MTSMRPVPEKYGVTQNYYGGFSTQFSGGAWHGAIDYGTPVGVEVLAPDDMVIEFCGWAWELAGGPNDWAARLYLLKPAVGDTRGGGGIITIGRNKAGSRWVFCHLSDNNMVRVGQWMKRGQVVGKTGATGIVTGAHLHVELIPAYPNWNNGAYGRIDPAPWLTIPYKKTSSTTPAKTAAAAATTPARAPYRLETNRRTGFFMPRANYGFGSKIVGVTIHHWGSDGQTFNNVANFLCDTTSPARRANPTSAHYVVEDGRVSRLADDSVATYHAGNARGNGTTIGVECRPEMSPQDFETVAQLLADLERKHGDLMVYRHQDWFPTQCAGRYNSQIDRLVKRVNQIKATPVVVRPAVSGVKDELEEIMSFYKSRAEFEAAIGRAAWSYKNAKVNGGKDAYQLLTNAERNSASAVQLAKGIPASVLQAKVKRVGVGAGQDVNLAAQLAYDRDNWDRDRASSKRMEERLTALETKFDQVIDLLTKEK